jgi:hypothetical protein
MPARKALQGNGNQAAKDKGPPIGDPLQEIRSAQARINPSA